MSDYAGQPCVMGIDVGGLLHVVIREHVPYVRGTDRIPRQEKPARLWLAQAIDWSELDSLVARFQVKSVVIDAAPDLKLARDFVVAHRPIAWLARYDQHNGNLYKKDTPKRSDEPRVLHIDRLMAMDETLERVRGCQVELPGDARHLGGAIKHGQGEYYRQMQAPQRVLEKDSQGNPVWRWQDNGKDDHYAHAELYCMLAGMVSPSGASQLRVFTVPSASSLQRSRTHHLAVGEW